jgi:hypothetical protein
MGTVPCKLIVDQIGQLFKCDPMTISSESYVKIRTPYTYPDGDVIELFYRDSPTGPLLTDFGETLRWLNGQTVSERRTKRHGELIADVCETHQVVLSKGHLSIRVPQPEMMAHAVTRLAQAAVRIGDLSFTFRGRLFESFDEEVEDFLVDRQIKVERRARVRGETKSWTVDLRAVPQPNREALVYTLSTESKAQVRRLTNDVVAAFYDLRHQRNGTHFISLFDDSVDVWDEADFKELESLSDVLVWSKPDDLVDRVAS